MPRTEQRKLNMQLIKRQITRGKKRQGMPAKICKLQIGFHFHGSTASENEIKIISST